MTENQEKLEINEYYINLYLKGSLQMEFTAG